MGLFPVGVHIISSIPTNCSTGHSERGQQITDSYRVHWGMYSTSLHFTCALSKSKPELNCGGQRSECWFKDVCEVCTHVQYACTVKCMILKCYMIETLPSDGIELKLLSTVIYYLKYQSTFSPTQTHAHSGTCTQSHRLHSSVLFAATG